MLGARSLRVEFNLTQRRQPIVDVIDARLSVVNLDVIAGTVH